MMSEVGVCVPISKNKHWKRSVLPTTGIIIDSCLYGACKIWEGRVYLHYYHDIYLMYVLFK